MQLEAAMREAIEATKAKDVKRAVKVLTRLAGVEKSSLRSITIDW